MAKDVITVETLKKGLEALNVKSALKNKDKLEKLVEETIQNLGLEVEFQCGVCDKLIPDVPVCPYCSHDYSDEVETENQEEMEDQEENQEDAEDQEEDQEEIEDQEENQEDAEDQEEDQEETENQENAEDQEETEDQEEGKGKEESVEDEDVLNGKSKKGKNSKKDEKKNNEKKDSNPKDKKPKTEKPKKVDLATPLIEKAQEVVGEELHLKDGASLASFFMDPNKKDNRVFSILKNSKQITLYMCVEGMNEADDLKTLTDEEAKKQHLGKIRAIYEGDSIDRAIEFIKEATKKFKPQIKETKKPKEE